MCPDPHRSRPRKTVLVVDDDFDARMICEIVLSHHGYRVVATGDGESALALIQREAPAAIVLDLGLPRMEGWTVAETLMASEATAGIPVVLYSAHAFEADRSRARKLGFAAYLVKPCSPLLVVEAVQRCAGPPELPLAGRDDDEMPLTPALA